MKKREPVVLNLHGSTEKLVASFVRSCSRFCANAWINAELEESAGAVVELGSCTAGN